MKPRVELVWGCQKCGASGTVKVYPYPHENDGLTADRETTRTRQACVVGCVYIARVKS